MEQEASLMNVQTSTDTSCCFLSFVAVVSETKCEARLGDKEVGIKQLTVEIKNLEQLIDQLRRERDNLSQNQKGILTFNKFPASDFSPNKTCQLCQSGWILFQGKCYLFYKKAGPWFTWDQSREYCQGRSADLVVIDNLQEQEFVTNHSVYYYDPICGYWLGLQQINRIWIWVDGQEDNLGYWMQQPYGASGAFAMLIPRPNGTVPPVTQNWDTCHNLYSFRFICERDALIISN
uniref:Asialoglycoprotein receptor 1-like n=1 Tax=Nothobranchius furzeri TaxID=105023 RepID=A0A8C6KTJ9_NOTFU